jgi:ribosomal protein S18 acetylase RimI-like enzyme
MASAPDGSFKLIETLASEPAGVARADLFVGSEQVGEVDFQVCASCRRGILHHIRVEAAHRRRGLAHHAVTTLLARYEDCTWSASATSSGSAAQAFLESVGLTVVDAPVSCRHMRAADGPPADRRRTPDTPWSAPGSR